MAKVTNLKSKLTWSSGIPPLDEALEGPKWGDTLVFHLGHEQEYAHFLGPLDAILDKEGISTHFIQFDEGGLPTWRPDNRCRVHSFLQRATQLERLTTQICQLVRQEGRRNFYLFDNLETIGKIAGYEQRIPELLRQVMGEITRRECAAYVPLQRGFLPAPAVAQIKDAAPVFIDVWSIDQARYFQVLKAQGRYSERLFQKYKFKGKNIQAVLGADIEEYAGALEQRSREFLELYAQKRHVENDLHRKVFELSLLDDIARSLLSTLNLEEILHRILIGVTAKEGLGFNRAFLLLINESDRVLEGKMAIGPSNFDEAMRIWSALSGRKLSLEELAALGKDWQHQDAQVNNLVHRIRVPLADRSHLFCELLREMQPEIIASDLPSHHHSEEVLSLLGVESFAAVPLQSRKRSLGLLLADNLVTQKKISQEHLRSLETFANYASSAVEHARLYEEVRTRIKEGERHLRELETMQDRLMHSKKLSTLGELASKMAHEIRTPLVSIGGFANALLKKRPADSEDAEYLKIIVNEVRRLEAILSDVLMFVSPGIPRRQMVDLRQLIDQLLIMLSLPIREKCIQVTVCADPAALCRVDPDQMKQVLTAIVNNAIESMVEEGKLTIRMACQNDFVRISIADTGTGISEDKLDKLFDAFFTTKSTGSGLGLNIASQIVANHKGSIYVESQLGVGSTFYINLPMVSS